MKPELIPDQIDQRTLYLQHLAAKIKELPELEKHIVDKLPTDSNLFAIINQKEEELNQAIINRQLGAHNSAIGNNYQFDTQLSYQPMLPKPQMKTYMSPEFQSELKELTEKHFLNKGYSENKSDGFPLINEKRSL